MKKLPDSARMLILAVILSAAVGFGMANAKSVDATMMFTCSKEEENCGCVGAFCTDWPVGDCAQSSEC